MAAPTVQQAATTTASGSGVTSVNLSLASLPTAGNCIVAAIYHGAALTSVTDNGAAGSSSYAEQQTSAGGTRSIWATFNAKPAATTHTVTATMGSSQTMRLTLIEFNLQGGAKDTGDTYSQYLTGSWYCAPSGAIDTRPNVAIVAVGTAAGDLSPTGSWTEFGNTSFSGFIAMYRLADTGATDERGNYTGSGPDTGVGVIASFYRPPDVIYQTVIEDYCVSSSQILGTLNSGTSQSNRIMIGVVSLDGTADITLIQYAGVDMTPLAGVTNRCRIFYLLNPTTGSNTLRIDFSAATNATATFGVYYGVDQTNPFNESNIKWTNGSGTAASVTITAAATNRVVDMIGVNGGDAESLTSETGDNETTREVTTTLGSPGGNKSGLADLAGTGYSTTPGWTWSATETYAQCCVELYASGAAPTKHIALVQSNSGSSTVQNPALAFPGGLTAGNLVVVSISFSDPGTGSVNSITDSYGNTYTYVCRSGPATAGTSTSNGSIEIWYAKNVQPSGGTDTVTFWTTNIGQSKSFVIAEFSGCDTSAPLVASDTNNQETDVTLHHCGTTNCDTTGEALLVARGYSGAIGQAGPGFIRYEGPTNAYHMIQYRVSTSALTDETGGPYLTTAIAESVNGIAAFKVAGAGEDVPVTAYSGTRIEVVSANW